MKKVVLLLLVLSVIAVFTSCEFVAYFHDCENACPVCGGCLDYNCVMDVCATKCEGNHPEHQHSLSFVEGKPASCEEDGFEGYYVCACEKMFSDEAGENEIKAPTVLEATGHTEQTLEAKAATCTETGLTEGKKCSTCGVTTLAQETISAKGHTFTNYLSNGDATCLDDGTKTAKCDRCDETDTKTDEGTAKGHDYGNVWMSDADSHWHVCANGCGINGDEAAHTPNISSATETEAKICTECSYVIEQAFGHKTHNYNIPQMDDTHHWNKCYGCDQIDGKVAHSYSEEITLAATCTTAGTKKLTCSCGHTKNETIAAKGHTEQTVAGKAATCTETGLTDGKKCSVCGVTTLKQETIAAKGHTNSAVKVENNVAPDCTNAGSYDNVIYCSVCTVEVSRTTVPVAAKGHTEQTVAGKAATCTETGLTDGKKCSTCGVTTLKQETIAAKGHTNSAVKVENNVAPDCTNAGSYDNVIYCSVCTVEVSRTTVPVAAKGHTEQTVAGKAATCTETGLTEGKKCSVCGVTTLAQQTIPTEPHSFDLGKCTACGASDPDYVEVIFSVPQDVLSVTMGSGNILPSASAPAGYSFAGWSTTAINETATKPTLLLAGSKYTGTATLLYAVYTRTVSAPASSEFVKVTTAPTDWSGSYLIVYEDGKVAFNGGLATLDAVSNTVSVSIANGKISATSTLKGAMFIITKSGDSYYIKSTSGSYIYKTADNNGLDSNASAKYANSITINSDGTVNIIGSGGAYLRYNATSGQTRFRYFKSSTYTGQKAITLYKLTESASVTTTYYCTLSGEVTCNHNYTATVTAPTCTEAGYTTHTCSKCGDAYKDSSTSALGHSYSNGKCTRCGEQAESVTLTFDNTSKRTEYSTSKQVWVENGITVTNNKGSSTSNIGNYANPVRFYANSQLIIASSGMTKIEVTCNTASYATALKNSISAGNGVSVSVSGSVVTISFTSPTNSLTISKLSAQVQVKSIKVYYI